MAGKYKLIKGKGLYCPNARTTGYNRYMVVSGDFIAWRYTYKTVDGDERSDRFYGRVLGEALLDGDGRPYLNGRKKHRHLAVLHIGEEMNHGYVNHVPIETVEFIRTPGPFLAWALFGEMPKDIELLERLVKYGSISDGHIEKVLDDVKLGARIVRLPWDKE